MYMLRTILCIDVTSRLGMGFSFYLLRRLKLIAFIRVSRITFVPSDFSVLLSFILTFVRSFDVGKIKRTDNTILDWFTDGNLPPSRFTVVFLSSTCQLFFPPPLGDHLSFFRDTHRRHTPPLQTFADAIALH
jgi:hypothetical protein